MLISKEQAVKIIESCMPDKFVCAECISYAGILPVNEPEVAGTVARCHVCWTRRPCHSIHEWKDVAAAA